MGIDTTKSFADITEGTQVVVEVVDAEYDEEGRFGAAIELTLEVLRPTEHAGDTILSTFGLSQPRLNKVRNLRNDGLGDAAIADVLNNKGFEFKKIDEPETPRLGGALLRVVKACYDADPRQVKKLLAECNGFDDLADALIGRRFVATTRKDKNDYTRLDGKGEFFRVMGDDARNGGSDATMESAVNAIRESTPGDNVKDIVQKQRETAAAKKAHYNRVDDEGYVEGEEDIPF